MANLTSKFPEAVSPTKITYVDGRPTTITLRRCKLVAVRDGEVTEHVFDKDVVTIGAMEDNDLVLDDETVSRNHCKIFLEGDQYMVADLDSTNGTFVNRVRIREAWLKPDCTVTLGKTELRFMPVDEKLNVVPSDKQRYGEIIGRNAKIREVYAILEKISPTDATVIIEGETGTGKEVVARTIHTQSRRREGPFIVFDCSAVPENLIESELFGHEKGSFTGAFNTRQGVFEMAHGGTVFLDELGELALELQPKLLRVLEQREVKRVGGSRPIKVDVRVVAATNRDLEEEVREQRFREDLFYRLSVVRLLLPPLRERKEDIPLLIKHFLKGGNFNRDRDGGRKVNQIHPAALQRMMDYEWPGNVRELLNVVERAVSFSETGQIEPSDLPDHVGGRSMPTPAAIAMPHLPGMGGLVHGHGHGDTRPAVKTGSGPAVHPEPEYGGTFKDAKEKWITSFERDYILHLLRKNNNNISHAARESEIDRKYFRKLMKKYGISAGTEDLDDDSGVEEL